MYDVDTPKSFLILLLEQFLTETERTVSFFFAFIIFLCSFVLSIFGRDGWHVGLIGIFCLLILKLRDIIEGFADLRRSKYEIKSAAKEARKASRDIEKSAENIQQMYAAFNDSAVLLMAHNFNNKFTPDKTTSEDPEESSLLHYLKSCQKIIEAAELFFPGKPLNTQTRKALNVMIPKARDYFIKTLSKRYGLSDETVTHIKEVCQDGADSDIASVETILRQNGADENTIAWSAKVLRILNWIQEKTHLEETPDASGSSSQPSETGGIVLSTDV